MKKQIICLILAAVAAISGSGELKSQVLTAENIQEQSIRSGIHPNALKDFSKKYTALLLERWWKISDGFLASFNLNEIKYTVFYNRKGRWTGSLKNYTEEKLLYELKEKVKKEFDGYAIFHVAEIETVESMGMPTYFIYTEGLKDYKVLRINDGQLDVKSAWQKH